MGCVVLCWWLKYNVKLYCLSYLASSIAMLTDTKIAGKRLYLAQDTSNAPRCAENNSVPNLRKYLRAWSVVRGLYTLEPNLNHLQWMRKDNRCWQTRWRLNPDLRGRISSYNDLRPRAGRDLARWRLIIFTENVSDFCRSYLRQVIFHRLKKSYPSRWRGKQVSGLENNRPCFGLCRKLWRPRFLSNRKMPFTHSRWKFCCHFSERKRRQRMLN